MRWTEEEFEDFRQEMWLAVHEGAFLHELPRGAIDHLRDGTVERHGPWPPEECSRCLLTWFDRGWLTLFVESEQLFRWTPGDEALQPDPDDERACIIAPDRARAILGDPRCWTNDHPEAFVVLNPSRYAPSSDFRQLWLDAIESPH